MEAIGAGTDNPDHRQTIATIFAHYYKINPHKKRRSYKIYIGWGSNSYQCPFISYCNYFSESCYLE